MHGSPLEDVKKALLASLERLSPGDTFNIIAFNEEIRLFSSMMELATVEAISSVIQWLNSNLVAAGGTDILVPLKQAMKLLEGCDNVIPLVFLVTDGSVENEREICNVMREYCCRNEGSISPRICTFGSGSFCNHYFLRMLAQLGKGYYDHAIDTDSIELRLRRLFETASSTIIANTTLDALKLLSSVELFPSQIPDLTLGKPLILSGRYKGQFPDSVEVRGTLADMSCFTIELNVQKAKDIPLDKVLARRQINELTARAWFEEKKEIEEKVTKLSTQTGFPCEFTQMVLLKPDDEKIHAKPMSIKEILRNPAYQIQKQMEPIIEKIILLRHQRLGFGNTAATSKNIPPGSEEPKDPEGAELLMKAAAGCCRRMADRCCCMCFLQTCSSLNDQCTIVFSQLCAALACFECLSCCCDVCECLDCL